MRALWFIANVVLMAAFVSSNESFEGSHSSFGRGCPNGHFECSDGECLLLKHRCDYEDDCSDGSDEKDCDIHDSFSSCRSDYFQCDDRECILHEKHCDHKEDCSDGSDEINCGLIWCEEPDFFKCDNGVCIDHEMVCDGKRDCHDGSDEELPTCPHNIEQSARKGCLAYAEFKCGDGLCIPKSWICDGEVNCMDSSDESPALCSKHHCALDEFQCRNGRCIIRKFECDGADDCKDGSDEENCPDRVIPPEECTLENKAFLCKDKLHCIQIYKLCDGHRDCLDDSDEGGKCNETAECHDANCSTQQCYSSPDGHFCLCAQGYKYEKGACVDIDECQNFGVCDQKCENTPGSYRCLCDHHYILQKDMRTCRAEGPEEAKILYSLGNDIGMRYLKSNMQHHVRNVSQAVGVECDGHHLFWSNIYDGQEAIMKAELLGTDRRPIVTAGLGEPEDLAVDWITENIYFTDSRNDFIGVCSSNGKHCAVLHNRDINNPRGIALLPNEGYMFWSDWGDKPVIARSGMDGSDVFDFVSKDLQWPNGITIDHGNQRLYWVDAKLSTIESIRLDGKDRWKVLEGTVHHPYSVAVFEDTLYWSDWDTLEIESANKFTGKNRKTVVQERTRIFGIKIYHPAMQDRDQINYCFGAPCTDLCLLAPVGQGQPAGRGYTCACPEGKQLSANNHSCIVTDKKQIIVIGSRDRLFQYEHKRLGLAHVEELPLEQRTAMLGDVSVIEYNSLDGSLIVGDAHNRKMSAVNMDTLETRDIVTKDVGRIEGIAFDNLGSNIYWTDSELGKVEVINTHNHHRKIIMNHLQGDIPRGIAVIPSEGIMFVSLSSPRGAHIDKISMANGDVHSRTHMFEENLMGPFLPLFFDRMSELVFWADSATRRIEYTSPGGQERHTYAVLGVSPIDITSVGTDIFWTSSGTKRINYANKLLSDSDIKNVDLSGYVYSNSKIFITALRGIDSKRIHPCAYSNGNCSHLCLVSPKKDVQMECACPDGMYLEQPTQCAVLPACKRTEFECQLSSVTGIIRHCIPLNQKCNGRKDCPGGEDEDLAMCAEKELHKCLPGQFACLDGRRCIDESLVCNLLPDCDDHSDETAECGHSLGVCNSSTGRFQCGSGECVSEQRRCDSQIDCRDMSDEKECAERSCDTQTQFRCKSGSCIVKQFECDGDLDCADGSDEHKDCTYIRTCSPQQMTCDNGQCIDEELKCNGVNDCDDSSDERSCPQRHHTVESHLHHRASSPEGAAPSLPDCDNRYQFACESANSPDRCLPAAVRCNGTSECRNGEDELNCAGCHMDEFQCKNNRCVYHTWLCDRKDDCGDNSDEEAAVCQANSGGKLGSGTGVAKSDLRCFGSFRCTSDPSECIQTSMVCNGEKDCSDGSDEGALCDKGCENAGCTDNMCQRTPTGPKCACAKGYELMGDAKTCEDIDECATEEYCSQLCTNTPGAFSCSCHPQYVLRQDGMSCKAKGGEMQFVYAVYNEIRTMSGWHSHLGIVYSDPDFQMRVSGLAADVGRKHVYWTSATNDSLYRVSTENRRQVRSAHLERPSHLSMDWVTGNVYVVEATSQITAVNFEKRTYARLYKSDPAMNIEAFAVDPIMRTMFWSERLAHKVPFSSIYRSDTSGSNLVKVISSDLTQVSDIFIDTFHNQIYWADTATRKIERAFFDGSHRELVFNFTDVPTDITIFEDYMYVLVQPRLSADLKEMEEIGNVWRCGLYGSALDKCDQFRIHPKHFTTPYHFDIIHPGLQLKGHNDCSNSSECLEAGGTCLLRNHKLRPSAVCVCADGTRLRKDNVCPPDQQGSIFEGRDEIDTQLSARSPFNPKESFISVWWLVIGFVFVVVPVVGILFFVYRGGRPSPINPQWLPSFCTRRFPFHTIRFNSKFGNMDADDTIPAYSDFQFHPCQLNPGEHQYENPIAAMQEQNGAVTIKTMNEIDIQVGPEKTGWMGMDGMHGSPSEAGSESSTIEIAGVSNGDNCRTLLL